MSIKLITSFSVANASDFCNGFKHGFIRGYKSAKNRNTESNGTI